MTKPLALIVYDNLLPGSQLVNRFEDLGYRVQTVSKPKLLFEYAQREKPLVVVIDLESHKPDVCAAIKQIKEHPVTTHIPVIAFARERSEDLQASAHAAGARLVASDTAILIHLPQFLEQALEVD